MMLLLLSYSLRKRLKPLRRLFNIRYWFQFHMTLGILGPLAILFHSNFHLGSLNSTVALVCMLLVAGSGIVGRYFYGRIHHGLYGEKIRLREVARDFAAVRERLTALAVTGKQQAAVEKIFGAIDSTLNSHETGVFSAWRGRGRVRKIAGALRQLVKHLEEYHQDRIGNPHEFKEMRRTLQQSCSAMLDVLQKLPGLQLFERLFSLWHVIHIPIFGLMIITAVTHVIVVHMY